ncbi:MAG: peptidoglycan-associated lipoprotein Pal [Thermodesulfobacteriota bacterium]
MKSRIIVSVAVLAMVLMLGAGCAKKQVESQPQVQPAATEKAGGEVKGEDVEAAAKKKAMQQAMDTITNERIYFDFDKFELKPEYKEILKKKAELLKKYPNFKVLIEGHCDERGTEEYNLGLGEKRAKVAMEFLVIQGVDVSRLKIVSYGEERATCTEKTESCWSKNRRDEFKVF